MKEVPLQYFLWFYKKPSNSIHLRRQNWVTFLLKCHLNYFFQNPGKVNSNIG
ncbi:MAG: hypothetical protein ACI8WT_003075 [Clostridium sp.]|jgi:hypothetical protein